MCVDPEAVRGSARQSARTMAQNEETGALFGMPKEAIHLQAVDQILPLELIAKALWQFDSRA